MKVSGLNIILLLGATASVAQALIVTEIELYFTTIYANAIETSYIGSSNGSNSTATDVKNTGVQITVSVSQEPTTTITKTKITTTTDPAARVYTSQDTVEYTSQYTSVISSEYTLDYTTQYSLLDAASYPAFEETTSASTTSTTPTSTTPTPTTSTTSSSISASSITSSESAQFQDDWFVTSTLSPSTTPVTSTPVTTTSSLTTSVSSTSTSNSDNTDDSFASQILEQHNAKRSLHKDTGALTWSSSLASTAQSYADSYDCSGTLVHSHGDYGQNLALGYNLYTGTTGVDAWYDEISKYDYSNPGFSSATGHFTQVVWKSTSQVGCGYKSCNNEWGTYLVCNYYTPGNVIGEFSENVLPLN